MNNNKNYKSFWDKRENRNKIPSGYKLPLTLMLLLGGAQGVMGWYMVASGLVDVPSVSHYRLAAHLGLAFLIFSLLVWLGLSLLQTKRHSHSTLLNHAWGVLGFLALTIFWGAYTAGLDAGMVYNESYPLMGGQFIPPDMWQHNPAWVNFFEQPSGVQFVHRWLAALAFLSAISLIAHAWHREHLFPALMVLGMLVFIQFGLGIATLLSGVHIALATAHPATAL